MRIFFAAFTSGLNQRLNGFFVKKGSVINKVLDDEAIAWRFKSCTYNPIVTYCFLVPLSLYPALNPLPKYDLGP